jgi:hypothetical protein
MLDPILHLHQLNLQFLELAFVELTIKLDARPLWMGCEIIEDRSGAVGVAWIQPTTAFGREVPDLAGLLGFIFT